MKSFLGKIIFVNVLLLFAFSCETPNNNNTPTDGISAIDSSTVPSNYNKPLAPQPQKDCELAGKILEANRVMVEEQNTIICIMADESTQDKKLGDSHRILAAFNSQTCELIKKVTLPVNISPDYPYLIADIIYNNTSHLVAIKGHGVVYCYDVENQKLLPPLVPEFLSERLAADTQSGKILHLEVWENYLVGFAEDIGTFAFDLTNTERPKVLLPVAEYDLSEGEQEYFSSLFFLKSQNGETYQAILPTYDYDEFKFHINPMFKKSENINPSLPKNIRDNRFLILKTKENKAFAVDMKTQKNVALPDEIKEQSTKEILDWLKQR